jgi:hypothetical protein
MALRRQATRAHERLLWGRTGLGVALPQGHTSPAPGVSIRPHQPTRFAGSRRDEVARHDAQPLGFRSFSSIPFHFMTRR